MSFLSRCKPLLLPGIRTASLLPGCFLRQRRKLERGPENVLVIALDHRGDVLWTTPVLRALNEAWPGCAVDYWTAARGAGVVDGNPRVRRVFVCDAVNTDRTREPPTDWDRLAAFADIELGRGRYSVVLDFTGVWTTTFLSHYLGTPEALIVGKSVQGLDQFYRRGVTRPGLHRLAQNLRFLLPLGIAAHGARPELYISVEEAAWASGILGIQVEAGELGRAANSQVPRLVVHPGAGWPAKTAPEAWWLDLLARLRDVPTFCVLGPSELDSPLARVKSAAYRVLRPPSFGALAALMAGCRAFLGCDSGPAHLSGIARNRSLVLYGPTNPALVRPWGPSVRCLRSPTSRIGDLPTDLVGASVQSEFSLGDHEDAPAKSAERTTDRHLTSSG